jgi:TRAP transporter TAXI family solute receptor
VTKASGIKKVSELKGKRVSTGAPGSGTEVMALRVLEAGGINHEKDIRKDRLGASESAGALKDGKIDAFFFTGGVPTGAILDLSATPGMTISIVAHGDLIPAMVAKSGPIYYKAVIPKKVYSGVEEDVPVSAVGNLLMTYQDLDEALAYNIMKTLFDRVPELIAIHKEAQSINLKDAAGEKGVPYHKGAQKYLKEKGFDVPA